MKLDFNGLRLNLQEQVNDITQALNDNYDEDDDSLSLSDFALSDLSKKLKDLRNSIVILMCLHVEGNDDIRSLADDVNLTIPDFS